MALRQAAAAACLLVLGAAAPATAQELIANGTFDTDLDGWENVSPAKIWSDLDAADDPGSGSVEITHLAATQTGVFVNQCVPITGGEIYTYRASHFTAPGEASGRADVSLVYYSSATCEGSDALTFDVTGGTTVGAWTELLGSLEAPANAVAATLNLSVFKTSGGVQTPVVVNYDDASLVLPEPASTSLGAAALAALALRRRLRARTSAPSASAPEAPSSAAPGSGAACM
jgi:hypothetical protein